MSSFKFAASIVLAASSINFLAGFIFMQMNLGCGRGIFDVLFFNDTCSSLWFVQDIVFFGSALLALIIKEYLRLRRLQRLVANASNSNNSDNSAHLVAKQNEHYKVSSPRRPQTISEIEVQNAIEGEWIEASKA